MRQFLLSVGLATTMAVPAVAQQLPPPDALPPAVVVPPPVVEVPPPAVVVPPPAVVAPPATVGEGLRGPNSPNVYDEKGNRIGRDPDPRIRDQIRQDPPRHEQ